MSRPPQQAPRRSLHLPWTGTGLARLARGLRRRRGITEREVPRQGLSCLPSGVHVPSMGCGSRLCEALAQMITGSLRRSPQLCALVARYSSRSLLWPALFTEEREGQLCVAC
jgi:hypothetical protein